MADTAICDAPPSATAARDLVAGDPAALPRVVLSYLGRAAMVGGAMYLAGARTHVLRDALAGTAVLELLILLWFARDEERRRSDLARRDPAAPPPGCPELPTSRAARALARGDFGALPRVALDVTLRGAELAAGMYLAGSRDLGPLARDALAGSLGVELFLVAHAALPR